MATGSGWPGITLATAVGSLGAFARPKKTTIAADTGIWSYRGTFTVFLADRCILGSILVSFIFAVSLDQIRHARGERIGRAAAARS